MLQISAVQARNPRTVEKIKIEAKRAPAFKAGKAMKEAVEKKQRSQQELSPVRKYLPAKKENL